MATTAWIRCAHCLARIPSTEATRVGEDLVCATCASLVGELGARPATFEPFGEARPDPAAPERAAFPSSPTARADRAIRSVANARPLPLADGDEGAARIAEEVGRDARSPAHPAHPAHPGFRPDPRLERAVPAGPWDQPPDLRRDPTVQFDAADPDAPAQRILATIDAWCAGKWWFARAPLLLYLALVWVRHTADPTYQSLFKGLNLGVHELGHYVFGPFGDIMAAWGGSVLQCLVPILAVPMFLRQRDWFAVFVAIGWLGTNLFEVAAYAADAVRMDLPLVTPGGGHPIHDWNYILGAKGWLRHTELVAALHRNAGHLAMAISLAGGSWICWRMFVLGVRRVAPGGPAKRAPGDG